MPEVHGKSAEYAVPIHSDPTTPLLTLIQRTALVEADFVIQVVESINDPWIVSRKVSLTVKSKQQFDCLGYIWY